MLRHHLWMQLTCKTWPRANASFCRSTEKNSKHIPHEGGGSGAAEVDGIAETEGTADKEAVAEVGGPEEPEELWLCRS
jgi:hypothetical protein